MFSCFVYHSATCFFTQPYVFGDLSMLINVIFVHRFSQLFNAVLYKYTKDHLSILF